MPGYYGKNCSLSCPLKCQEGHCNVIDGTCLGCVDGYQGPYCNNGNYVGFEIFNVLPARQDKYTFAVFNVWFFFIVKQFLMFRVMEQLHAKKTFASHSYNMTIKNIYFFQSAALARMGLNVKIYVVTVVTVIGVIT